MKSLHRTITLYKSYFTPPTIVKILILPAILLAYFTTISLISKVDSEASPIEKTYTHTVHQVSNPKTSASLLTIHESEVKSAARNHGFTNSDKLFLASPAPAKGLTPIYRIYNEKTGDFMVTQWPAEVANAIKKYGYRNEGITFYASAGKTKETTPVYKLLKGSFHRYATTPADIRALEEDDWKKEGVAFYAKSIASATATPTTKQPTQSTPEPVAPTTTPVTPPSNSTKVLSADTVLWSSIARPGQTLHEVLQNPALHGKILKLPEGVFEVANFRDGYKAINIPPQVKGLVGSGRDTVIRMKANTSTYGHTVPAQSTRSTNQLYIMRMNDGVKSQLLADFWLQGTEQGHLYNGIMVGKSQPGTTVQNIYVTGVPGDARENPGETFGLTFWRGSHSVTRDVEVDGRRITGNNYAQRTYGTSVGASGLAFSTHDYARVYDTYIHDHRYGMPTFWQSNYGQTWNLKSIRNRIGVNHERSFGTIHHQPIMHTTHAKYHVTFLSDYGNGSLKIIGSTNDEWTNGSTMGPIGKNKKMVIITSTDYRGPNTNSITTRPTVVLDDGKTAAPYLWAH